LVAARKEIQEWAGRQFDPEVVEVFLQMSDDVFEELRRAIGGHVDPLAYSAGAKD
jgi:response regulator RpfG family c-di-GMP phosphodiesterase